MPRSASSTARDRTRVGAPSSADLVRSEEDLETGPPLIGSVLRAARRHHGWSIREVERRTGRDNTYLSQVERGVIRRPDPVVLMQLADLYGLNFSLLAEWAGMTDAGDADTAQSDVSVLVKMVMDLGPVERAEAITFLSRLLNERRT